MEQQDWRRAMVLMGVYGGEYKPVALDADGKLYTLIQGDDEGTLRTVAVDSEGRLSAFVVDSSDVWEEIVSVGNAELAARLGSIVKYDKRGQLMFMETFEYGLHRWEETLAGGGAAVALCVDTYLSRGLCLKMTSGTAGGESCKMNHTRGYLPVGRYGLELAWTVPANMDEFQVSLQFHDGSQQASFFWRYDDGDGDFDIYDSDGQWVKVGDVKPIIGESKQWNIMKVVVNTDTGYYVRAQFNGEAYDISSTERGKTASGLDPQVILRLTNLGRTLFNDIIYVDDVILTAAEPA